MLIFLLFVTVSLAVAKPMTAYVESWEGRFSPLPDHILIRVEGKPTLLLWLYQSDRGSKGTVVGFSTESGDMIVTPKGMAGRRWSKGTITETILYSLLQCHGTQASMRRSGKEPVTRGWRQ